MTQQLFSHRRRAVFAVGTLKDHFIGAALGDIFQELPIIIVIVIIFQAVDGLIISRIGIRENKALNERREKRNTSIQRATALFVDNIIK